MFCINCGKQLPEGARFCAYCGANLLDMKKSLNNFTVVTIDVEEPSNAVIIADEPKKIAFTKQNQKNDTPEEAYLFARRYELGEGGCERNLRKAFDWYVKAAKSGHVESQFRLGCAYENGELNLKENCEKAYDWYLEAANNGYVDAMFLLAEAYNYEELELDEDEDEAFEWYLKAAEKGHVDAQVIVAEAYEYENLGVDEDQEEALKWYVKAADNGSVEAMYKAAELYYWMAREIADETEEDDEEEFAVTDEEIKCMDSAKQWFGRAAMNGHEQAKRMLRHYFSD